MTVLFDGFSQEVQNFEIERILSKYKNQQIIKKIKIYSLKSKAEIANVFYNDDFFVVISTDKKFYPVQAYSKTNGINDFFVEEFINFMELIYDKEEQKIYKHPEVIKKNLEEWNNLLKNSKGKDITFGPWVKSNFGQVNCKDQYGNIINVTNIYTPKNVAVGCVAISQSTVLHYYGWPNQGMGMHNYSDNYGSLTGNYTVNYDSSFYQMNLIKNFYNYQVSTTDERKALGKLAYEVAVSINMDFENGGSTSNVDRVPGALASHFRFTSKYNSIEVPDFWQITDSNIIIGLPVILAISSDNGAGHSVVCSGLKILDNEKKYYHLNMGWWGSANGWYQIHDEFYVDAYTSVTGGVFDIVPNPHLFEPKFNTENNQLNIEWSYPEIPEFDNYQLQMKLNRENWATIEDILSENFYTIFLDGSSTYSFRVRPQSINENIFYGWSNYITFSDYVNGINDKIIQHKLKYYPNPVNDKLYVEYGNTELKVCSVQIFNTSGHYFIVDYSMNDNTLEIDVKDLPNGIYILRIYFTDQLVTNTFFKINT